MTPAKSENTNKIEKRDHRREVTDSIIKMLEEGVAPWQKPWEGSAMPFNPTTERSYRGGNAVHLLATGIGREYADPRWMTYKQAADQGWQVRKGEKGTHIEFWEVKDRSNDKDLGPNQNGAESPAKENGQRLIHRVYTVFNAKQIDGIPEYEPRKRTPFEAVQAGERILANSGARIEHDQFDNAFYNRRSDSIHLPPRDAFKDAPGYYGTALHELAHWTGHPSRLNRSTLSESYRFGDLNYAKEELRAELASVFLAAELGVPHDPANHAAYVSSWITALREDKNEIFRAAHDASSATDFVLSLDREVSRPEALELANSGFEGSPKFLEPGTVGGHAKEPAADRTPVDTSIIGQRASKPTIIQLEARRTLRTWPPHSPPPKKRLRMPLASPREHCAPRPKAVDTTGESLERQTITLFNACLRGLP